MTDDQHQPAAAAPRLSDEREEEIRASVKRETSITILLYTVDLRELISTLDATRADLARTRAEAAALRAERDDAVKALNDQVAALQAAIDRAKNFPCPSCGYPLAIACTCEEQPAAPVAPRGVACPPCGGDAFASFDVIVGRGCGHVIGATTPPVAPSAEGSDPPWIRRGVSATVHGRSWPYVTCMDCGWLTYTDSPTVVHHMADCPHATTPPDHQAGDEP